MLECELHVDALHPATYHMQDENYIDKAHGRGLRAHVWTVGCTASEDGCCADSDDAAVSLFAVLFSIAAALDDGTVSCCTANSTRNTAIY